MRKDRHDGALCSAPRRQMANSVAAMRELGLSEQDVSDATSQARAALRSSACEVSGDATPRNRKIILAVLKQITAAQNKVFVLVGTERLEAMLGKLPDSAARFRVIDSRMPLRVKASRAGRRVLRPGVRRV